MIFAKSKWYLLSIALFLTMSLLSIPQNARAQAPQIVSLYFSTVTDQININWITEYDGVAVDVKVDVKCELNGVQNCDPFPYSSDPGGGSCKIMSPPEPSIQYIMTRDPGDELRTVPNTIYCKAYDHDDPSIYSEVTKTFFPLSFELSMPPAMSLVVGEGQNLLITIKNNGTLSDTYKIEVISNDPEILIIENGEQSTQTLGTNDIQQIYVGINALLSEITTADVEISSDTSQKPNKIEFVSDPLFIVRGGVKSLPDFGFWGIVQIMLIAATVLVSFLF